VRDCKEILIQARYQIHETNEAKVALLKDFSGTIEDGPKKPEDRLDVLKKQANRR
jgi:hypothetical protein